MDIHIPDNSVDLSPPHSADRVLSPVRGSGLLRSQTPIKASPVGLRDQHSTSNGASNHPTMISTDNLHSTAALPNSQVCRTDLVYDQIMHLLYTIIHLSALVYVSYL